MRPAILTTTRTDAGMLQGRNGGLEAGIIGAVDTIIIPALCQVACSAHQPSLGFRKIHRCFTHSYLSIHQGTGQRVGVCSSRRMLPEKFQPVCQTLELRVTARDGRGSGLAARPAPRFGQPGECGKDRLLWWVMFQMS